MSNAHDISMTHCGKCIHFSRRMAVDGKLQWGAWCTLPAYQLDIPAVELKLGDPCPLIGDLIVVQQKDCIEQIIPEPGKCFECDSDMGKLYSHHIVPKIKGGKKTVSLCGKCHGKVHGTSCTVGELTKVALRDKRSRNEKTGGYVPYGYYLTVDGLLVANEDEQGAIAVMFERKEQGRALRAIARELQEKGYKTSRGNTKWYSQTISQILKSETRRRNGT